MFDIRSSLLTLKPRVRRSRNVLEVTTPLFVRALTLFSHRCTVIIDAKKRSILVLKTNAWFLSSHRRLTFDDVEHIAYSFSSIWTSWDIFGRVHDLVETFTVGLKLKDSVEILHVARYLGEGAAGDFATWLMGDDLLDLAGTQEDDSRHFVGELRTILEIPLGPPALTPRADSKGRTWKCSSCGRSVAPRPKCLYCGGAAGPSGEDGGR